MQTQHKNSHIRSCLRTCLLVKVGKSLLNNYKKKTQKTKIHTRLWDIKIIKILFFFFFVFLEVHRTKGDMENKYVCGTRSRVQTWALSEPSSLLLPPLPWSLNFLSLKGILLSLRIQALSASPQAKMEVQVHY